MDALGQDPGEREEVVVGGVAELQTRRDDPEVEQRPVRIRHRPWSRHRAGRAPLFRAFELREAGLQLLDPVAQQRELSGPLAQALDQLRTSLEREAGARRRRQVAGEHGGVKEGDEEHLPLELGPVSNGEYVPPPPSPVLREAARRARELIDRQSRRRGMSRRDFLRTSMAAAAVFVALDACTSDEHTARTGRKPGGTLTLPEETTVDPDAATDALGGDEFVFDLQTHFLEYDLSTPSGNFGSGFPQAACGDADARACFSLDHYLEEVFLRSDTRFAVVSAIPASANDGPLSTAQMDDARRTADLLCGDGRILIHGQALPTIGNLDAQLDAMNALSGAVSDRGLEGVHARAVTAGSSTTTIRRVPQVGQRVLWTASRETGVKIVSVHKGLGGGSPYAAPVDIGPAASAHPDIRFVVYHSGYEAGEHRRCVRRGRARASTGSSARFTRRRHRARARTCTPSSARRGST